MDVRLLSSLACIYQVPRVPLVYYIYIIKLSGVFSSQVSVRMELAQCCGRGAATKGSGSCGSGGSSCVGIV